jgi:ribosomal protein L18E
MKKLIAIVFALAISGAAYAGCGVKVAVDGKLTGFDAEKKELTIDKQTVTLAANATITDADGKAVKIEDLVGKAVNVSTDKHTKKAESVKAAKS